jgi:hypothetical protein
LKHMFMVSESLSFQRRCIIWPKSRNLEKVWKFIGQPGKIPNFIYFEVKLLMHLVT